MSFGCQTITSHKPTRALCAFRCDKGKNFRGFLSSADAAGFPALLVFSAGAAMSNESRMLRMNARRSNRDEPRMLLMRTHTCNYTDTQLLYRHRTTIQTHDYYTNTVIYRHMADKTHDYHNCFRDNPAIQTHDYYNRHASSIQTLLCIALYCFALLCICVALHCFVSLCIALFCFAPLCIALPRFAIALCCIALHCFALC